ncbi:MAG: hypoxanthine-guanine phosphoribosyltransferase [Gammaproteobacteria bacterium]|nr:hypoxanthine-guanine phosphoribosyltransferase [Gammaproteobacteria bacterium]MDH5652620.1 hypoxanthine-guanine phosphoribosyltransferase [Gammaproteobacteria bacterium]
MTPEQAEQAYQEADCLFSNAQVAAALDNMADAMQQRLAGSNPLMLVVMTGGIIPAGHLLTRLQFPMQIDYIHATRYRGETSGGTLHWIAEPSFPLQDRTVVIVDDILDEGVTLDELIKFCQAAGATAVYSAVLVEKNKPRAVSIKADFVGLVTEDRYLFGYGMDYKDYLRNAAGIYAVKGM